MGSVMPFVCSKFAKISFGIISEVFLVKRKLLMLLIFCRWLFTRWRRGNRWTTSCTRSRCTGSLCTRSTPSYLWRPAATAGFSSTTWGRSTSTSQLSCDTVYLQYINLPNLVELLSHRIYLRFNSGKIYALLLSVSKESKIIYLISIQL